jgi:hypothetical protein
MIIISIVAGIGAWYFREFTKTPRFALYLAAKAIEDGNSGDLLRYVDTRSLANKIVNISIDLKKEEAGVNLFKGNSLGSVKSTINLICRQGGKDVFTAATKNDLEEGITNLVQKQSSFSAIPFLFANIKENGNKARVALPLKNTSVSLPSLDFLEKPLSSEENILLELENQESQWRVVGIDRRQLELLLKSKPQTQNIVCG